MITPRGARRSGITLTEILIAILIMGVGLISLATLFPLGLLRLREASRLGRSAMTVRTAADDIDARALLYKPSFRTTWYGLRDPFVQDADPSGNYNVANTPGAGVLASGNTFLPANNLTTGNVNDPFSVAAGYSDNYSVLNLNSGLPVCYDPLWRSLTGVMPGVAPGAATGNYLFDPTLQIPAAYAANFDEARFGSGIFGGTSPFSPFIAGESDTKHPLASAHGLQRLTNFIPWDGNTSNDLNSQYGFTSTNLYLTAQPADVAGNVFTSIDDTVYNPVATRAGDPSSILPDMSAGSPQADYRFTWFFTGRQTDAGGNGAQFTGDIVVCDGRPFGFDPIPGTNAKAPTGETVVEAIYGYGGNTRAVLLRWKDTLPDPPLRAGGWICDTTYERSTPLYRVRTGNALVPFARAYWYQIAKRVDASVDAQYGAGYRSTVVTLVAPVRVITPYNGNFGTPIHANVALIMPSVVNVFNRAFEVH